MEWLRSVVAALDRPAIPWKALIIGFSVAEYGFESWLAHRQYQVLKRTTVPKQLQNEVDQKTFDKSQAYGRAKSTFGFWSGLFQQVKSAAIIYFDTYPWLWRIAGTAVTALPAWAPQFLRGEISRSLVFAFTYSFAETIIGLPFSYYYNFVLEEKYGFNKQTLKLWVEDLFKSQALSLGFGIPLGAAFLWIVRWGGDQFFYYIWLFMLAVQLAAITVYPIWIVPLFNKLTPLEEGELKNGVEALATKLKFPLDSLLVIDGSKRSSHSNAYFTGLPWKKNIVIYDTLIEKSGTKEIEAVLAHELGHWKEGHTTKLLGISSFHLFYIFALFSVFIKNNSLYEAFGFHDRPIIIGFILFNEVLSPTDSIVKFLMNGLTRKFEFEADAFSLNLGYSADLASSLIKLQIQNLSSMDADWLYSSYHYSHPILTERLKAVGWTSEKKVSNVKPTDEPKKEL